MSLLRVEGLRVTFSGTDNPVVVVDDATFALDSGRTLGLVGESGCGKSVTSLALMGLLPPGARVEGSILFDGRELSGLNERGWRSLRGSALAIVFQDPMTALNPLMTVGSQLGEVLALHRGLRGRAAHREAARWLERVGIPDPEARLRTWPHELSGGMRQRVLIALALCARPRVLLADEPTTALDVTIQAQIVDLLLDLQEELGMALLFISHDLSVVESVAHDVAVMYAGRVVESGPASEVLQHPLHPYTRGLLDAAPAFRPRQESRLPSIPGQVPHPGSWPSGCRFHPRCGFAEADCFNQLPESVHHSGCRRVSCLHPLTFGGIP